MAKYVKKVIWHSEYGEGLYPFCPHCNEFAYEQDKCVFCGKPYEWVESPVKPTVVEVDGYKVVQGSNNHINIFTADGRLVYHASCIVRKSEAELIELFRFYEDLRYES